MTIAHLQLISMLPSTFELNSLHSASNPVSRIFASRSRSLVTVAEANACLFTAYRAPVLGVEACESRDTPRGAVSLSEMLYVTCLGDGCRLGRGGPRFHRI